MEKSVKVKISVWTPLIAAVLWLSYMAIVPGGVIRYYSDLHHHSYFISQLTPIERVEMTSTSTVIKGEPAYFSLRTSRGFDRAKVTINYQDNSESPIIEVGVLTDKQVWNYDLKPMQNKLIGNLSAEWGKIAEEDVLLLQRERKYESIENFLKNLPEPERIATYNYVLKNDYKIADYEKSESAMTMETQLRGPHQFYTYIKDERLDYVFSFIDINKNKDADPITINIYDSNNNAVLAEKIADDGIANDGGEVKSAREVTIKKDALPEGVYKVEIKCNTDIIVGSITSMQKMMSFINKVWLYDAGRKDIGLFSDSRVLSAETINPSRLQTVNVGGSKLEIKDTFKQFGMRTKKQLNEIRLEKDDVMLSGDGMFSFRQNAFMNPNSKKINENSDVDGDGIDYIIARYPEPVLSGDHKKATMEFDLSKAYRENGRYSFLISAPRLGTPSNPGEILIKDIAVELSGKTLLNHLRQK